MAYTPHQWTDGTGLPISAQNLNAMEQGIKAAADKADQGPAAGSVGTQQIVDGAVTDVKIVGGKYLIGSTGGWEAIQDHLGTSFLQGGVYDDAAGTWTPNVQTSTGTTGGGSDDVVDANDPAYAGGMGFTRTAIENGAALQAATIAAAGRPVTAKAGDYPLVGCSLADQHVNWNLPGVYFQHPQSDTPAVVIERTPGTPRPAGPTYLTWWGPFNPTGVTVSGLLQAIPLPSGGFASYRGGRVYRIDSRDAYPWSWSALNLYNVGDTPVYTQTDGLMWQAETFPLLGIGLRVSSLSNGGPLESMMVKGDQSNAQGLVQSRLVGNSNGTGVGGNGGTTATESHITFTSVTGDFIDGENLVRVAGGNPTYPSSPIATVGQVVGVVNGAPVLLTNDLFVFQYGRTSAAQAIAGTNTPTRTDNTVQLREVNTVPVCRIRGLGLDVAGAREDPDTYVDNTLRTDVVQLRGVYMPDVEWRVKNAWTRAMCVWSDYMGRFVGRVDQMPNHAILTQQAFAYGMELKAGSKGTRVELQGHTVRHLFTTNPNQRTYSAANNYASGKWSQWDYGTQFRVKVHDSDVEAAFAPGIDTHPGDYYTTFENCRIYGGGSGGRYNTDNNSGFSARGFGTKWINCEVDASTVGWNIGGVEHDAGIAHRYRIENCRGLNALAQGIFTPNAMVPGQATVEVVGGVYTMRKDYPKDAAGTLETSATGKYGVQTCVQIGSGVALEVSGEAKFRRFGAAAITVRGTGGLVIWSMSVDFTDCPTSASAVRNDVGTGIATTNWVYDLKAKGNAFALLRNVTGNTTWNVLAGALRSHGTTPANVTSAGTPVWNNVAALTVA
jgi:hypothetical protein